MTELNDLYNDFILELYRNPVNKGILEHVDASYKDVNPFCGDVIEIFIKIDHGNIYDVGFLGEGCALSQAASSLLTEMVKGKEVEEVLKMGIDDLLQEMHLLQLKENPARIKCVALSLKVLKMALFQYLGKTQDITWKEVVD